MLHSRVIYNVIICLLQKSFLSSSWTTYFYSFNFKFFPCWGSNIWLMMYLLLHSNQCKVSGCIWFEGFKRHLPFGLKYSGHTMFTLVQLNIYITVPLLQIEFSKPSLKPIFFVLQNKTINECPVDQIMIAYLSRALWLQKCFIIRPLSSFLSFQHFTVSYAL